MSHIDIEVEHVTRVEGHGNIVLNAKDGTLEKVEWRVVEAPRLFEAFVRGQPYHHVHQVTSRICGICSIAHTLASLKATEAAMGVETSHQAEVIRKLALHGETIQSHVLHLGYLVAPDVFGVGSAISLVGKRPETVRHVIALHRLANGMCDLLAGRTTHPTNLVVGGVVRSFSRRRLETLKSKLGVELDTFNRLAEVFLGNVDVLPDFRRETEYIALTSETEYAIYDGRIGSTDTGTHPVDDYRAIVNEHVVPQSTAKYSKHARDAYSVGALARFNLNSGQLSPLAGKWADEFGLKAPEHNPFKNNVAQLVEVVHSLEDSIRLIDGLIERGVRDERRPRIEPKAGRGIGVVEAPRGILIHDYTYNESGICTRANCVIPTNQNHMNIQKDMEALAPTLLGLPREEIVLNLEMLVRAYDPCISCSTHYLDVSFI